MIPALILAALLVSLFIAYGIANARQRRSAAAYRAALITTADSWWDDYRAWRAAQVCVGCGASASTASKENMWLTETHCMACFRAGRGTYEQAEAARATFYQSRGRSPNFMAVQRGS